jgi:dephospho-CoA kinase
VTDLSTGKTIPVIGVVGGIGSGKSLVAAEMQRLGGYLIQGDQLGHEALRQPDIKERVLRRWGPPVLDAQGAIDRRLLGQRVFANPIELTELEAIVFPYIEQHITQEIDRARLQPEIKFVVLDAAIMLESGWAWFCDKIIFVDVPREQRLARLLAQRGWSEEEVNRRERAQMSLQEKRRCADAVVNNAASPEEVAHQVRELLAAWGCLSS